VGCREGARKSDVSGKEDFPELDRQGNCVSLEQTFLGVEVAGVCKS
jgi:hypothetical protein